MSKAEYYWQTNAKCPFFASESASHHKITCSEGPLNNTRLSLTFGGKDTGRKDYMRHYCCSEYESCEVFRLCSKKWE